MTPYSTQRSGGGSDIVDELSNTELTMPTVDGEIGGNLNLLDLQVEMAKTDGIVVEQDLVDGASGKATTQKHLNDDTKKQLLGDLSRTELYDHVTKVACLLPWIDQGSAGIEGVEYQPYEA